MKSYIRPQNITDWIVAIGLLFSVVIYVFRRVLIFSNPDYDFLPLFDRLMIFDNFEMIGIGIGTCAMTISGIQKLRIPALKQKGISYITNGVFGIIILIGLNLLVSFLLPNLVQKLMISDKVLVQIESRSNKENIRPDLKNQLRKIGAEVNYLKTGTVTTYLNDSDEIIEYKPTFKTSKIRKSIEIIMNASSRAQAWSIIWGAVLIASLLIGFMIDRYKIANQVKVP